MDPTPVDDAVDSSVDPPRIPLENYCPSGDILKSVGSIAPQYTHIPYGDGPPTPPQADQPECGPGLGCPQYPQQLLTLLIPLKDIFPRTVRLPCPLLTPDHPQLSPLDAQTLHDTVS